MFILFRCSAGGNHGWGNLKRLELIFNALKIKHKFDYLFIVELNKDVQNYLKLKKIKFVAIKNNNEKKVLKKLGSIDLSILELLHCSKNKQFLYKKISKKLIVLDDIADKNYISDILISCQKKLFQVKKVKNCKWYNDYSYFPFGPNYDVYLKKKKIINKEIKVVSIFLGGSNYIKNYINLGNILKNTNYKIQFLIGKENSRKIEKKLHKISKKFIIKIDSHQIPKYLFNSDIVFSGGGYTKIETAFLRTPMVCIPIHHHQKELINNFYKTFKIDKKIKSFVNENNLIDSLKYLNFKKRVKISNTFSKKFKTNGIHKILEIVSGQF